MKNGLSLALIFLKFGRWRTLSLAACVFLTLTAYAADTPATKITTTQAKKDVDAFFNGPLEKREAARKSLASAATPEERKIIFKVLSDGTFKQGKDQLKKGQYTYTYKIPFEHGELPEGEFIVQLPTKYNGKTP